MWNSLCEIISIVVNLRHCVCGVVGECGAADEALEYTASGCGAHVAEVDFLVDAAWTGECGVEGIWVVGSHDEETAWDMC